MAREQGGSTSPFFGDWNTFMGQSNIGYFIGCEWLRQLEKKYTVQEIAVLPADLLEHELLAFLKAET